MNICLAILTTGARRDALSACLRSVSALNIPETVKLDVLLVQNGRDEPDPGFSEMSVDPIRVDRFFAIAEPKEGIPFARNRALEYAAKQNYDYLAFIDDDTRPDPAWLEHSLSVLLIPNTDGVTGPQIPVFPEDAPPRLSRAKIYRERRLTHGRPCAWAATHNVIFSLSFVTKKNLHFNETFLTGGSDKEFFLRFTRSDGVLRWVSDAIVREPVVTERLSSKWAVKRAWRFGTTGFQIECSVRNRFSAAIVSIIKGSAYLGTGLLALPCILLPNSPAFLDGLCRISHGTGFLLGMTPFFRLRRYV